jgi:prepilin signal peptidase PulO-like enzyme (type II secretory pathway)
MLLVLFSLWVIAVPSYETLHPPRDLDQAIIDLVVVLLLITGLIFSIKWWIKLAGFVRTSGRQAVAIFLIAFCAWGLLLVVVMSSSGFFVPGLILGVVYAVGLYACIRWLRKLRRRERDQAVPQPPSSFAAAR